jgi:hypothetical protein
LEDSLTAATPPFEGEFEFPLTINVQNAKGNILKMRIQLEVASLNSARRGSIRANRREVVNSVTSRFCSLAAVCATTNEIVGINAGSGLKPVVF